MSTRTREECGHVACFDSDHCTLLGPLDTLKIAQKIDASMSETADALKDNPPEPQPRHYVLERDNVEVVVGVDRIGHGYTLIGGVDISQVTQGVKIESIVGDITKITVTVTALPAQIRAIGVVEIIDTQLDDPPND